MHLKTTSETISLAQNNWLLCSRPSATQGVSLHFLALLQTNSLVCKKDNQKEKRSQDWPDLPLQSKWPELYWDPDYKFSIEMFLRFQAPAQNSKESSIFVSSRMQSKLVLNSAQRYKLQQAF